MIEGLRIRGLGVISEADVALGPGLTVITGETGAGKTMVVTSLGLLLGGRADGGAVRQGLERADVEARVRLAAGSATADRVAEAGGELDDDVLLLARTVGADGRSRAFAGGRSVPNALLVELGADLVAVHGQSEQLLLLKGERRRSALDRFAGDEALAAEYRAAYEGLRAATARLAALEADDTERGLRLEVWRAGLAEIDAAAPVAGEDVELAEELERLGNAEALRQSAQGAHDALRADDGGDAISAVSAARRLLQSEAASDRQFAELADRLGSAMANLADVADELAALVADLDADPGRLDVLEQRRAQLNALRRKYAPGGDLAAVLAWADAARTGLEELDDSAEHLERLRQEAQDAAVRAAASAERLSAERRLAAERLGTLVTSELAALAMPNAVVRVAVEHAAAAEGADGLTLSDGSRVAYGPSGIDEVDFLLTPHRGAPERPISKGASGGELSRVMLALEVVFAGADPVPTFVFDEVDAGVGGAAAIEIGRRLARLSRSAQVLVVTHLAQVAAFADRHFVVAKADDGMVVRSGLVEVSGDERVHELARMLGGVAESDAAAAHAAELLGLAAAAKAEPAVADGARRAGRPTRAAARGAGGRSR